MRVLSADLWAPAPGSLITWTVTPGAGLAPVPAPMTFNQRNHLLGAQAGEPSVWIAAAFDVDGPVDVDALEAAFQDLVAGHPGLWVEAVRRSAAVPALPDCPGDTVGLVRHDPARFVWRRQDMPPTRTVEATREHLVAELAGRCAPFGYPAFLPAAISRPDRSTIVLGLDHLHTDAWSTTVVVDELATLYAAHTRRATPVLAMAGAVGVGAVAVRRSTASPLPTASLLPMTAARPTAMAMAGPTAVLVPTEVPVPMTVPLPIAAVRQMAAPLPMTAAAPTLSLDVPVSPVGPVSPAPGPAYVGVDDPRLATWHGFLRDRGWALPGFPLPLGVPDGERVPQRTVVRPLADSATADAVAARAAAAGASTSAAVLATFARAVADLGGPAVLETLLPVHTRADEPARRAVGWHTTTVPLRIEVDTPAPVGAWAAAGPGADTVTDMALAGTGKALRAARELSAVPLEQVLETLPHPLRFPRRDIFQVSYLDYRRLPGHATAAERRAHHISAATRADDLQVWVSRTADGVAVRARMPRTAVAVATVDAVLDRWSARLTELATG